MPKHPSTTAITLLVAYLVTVAVLALFGFKTWGIYCENFGCIGVGIAWFMWSAGFGATWVLGLFAYAKQAGPIKRLAQVVLALQTVAGVALIAYWAAR